MTVFTDVLNVDDLHQAESFYSQQTQSGLRRIVLSDRFPHLGRSFSYSAPGFSLEVQAPRADQPRQGPPAEGWWASVTWSIISGTKVYKTHDGGISSYDEPWLGDEEDEDGLVRGITLESEDAVSVSSYLDPRVEFLGSPTEMSAWLSGCKMVPGPLLEVVTAAIHEYDGPSIWASADRRWKNGPVQLPAADSAD